jgi:hypothetical protein
VLHEHARMLCSCVNGEENCVLTLKGVQNMILRFNNKLKTLEQSIVHAAFSPD